MIKILLMMSLLFSYNNNVNYSYLDRQINISISNFESEYVKYNYYNGEKIDDIISRVNKYLKTELKNKGEFIVKTSIEKEVDPYLSASVILLESGCRWNCSKVVKNCNNVAGNVGKPNCGKGHYRKFATLDDGIEYAIKVLSNYIKNGKNTPELIGPKYAGTTTWAKKVNNYMKLLKK